jgi:hypothetical protein
MSSNFDTLSVVAAGAREPTVLAKAADVPMRSQINNVGPVVLFVADDVNDLVPAPSLSSYRIMPGELHVLVLTAKESLYGVGAGTGGLASVANSEALPGDTA